MDGLSIFKNISYDEINEILKIIGARRISFRKDHIILSNLVDDDLIGIVLKGVASIVAYDYKGNRDIVENLEYDAIFGKTFSYFNSDVSIIASTDCEILFIDYQLLINDNSKFNQINYNINRILSSKIYQLYEKIEILSKRTIREKLLSYFNLLSKKRGKKSFNLPITYIELADYLFVDRSAMTREIKKLKDERIIYTNGKKITLNY